MAFDIKANGSYGSGALGDVNNPSGQINSYAQVSSYTATTITYNTSYISNGSYGRFTAGQEILIHVSATTSGATDTTYLGKYLVCKIVSVSGATLTIDKDFTQILPLANRSTYQIQIISICQFQNLTLTSSSITAPVYNVTNQYGGIVALKCSDTLSLSGGNINLNNIGIPYSSTGYRPLTAQETQGTRDDDTFSGFENSITASQFMLNCGDGAAFIIAKKIIANSISRIGNPSCSGSQFGRGAVDSVNYDSSYSNQGGSTILIACQDFAAFNPTLIAKYRTVANGAGRGLARCYIASDTKLRNDEGLYAYDCLSNNTRIMQTLNIKDYGDGSNGILTNPAQSLNNYAPVSSIDASGAVITIGTPTTSGIAPFAVGSMAMFHCSKLKASSDYSYFGKFVVAKIIGYSGNTVTLDTSIFTANIPANIYNAYYCQLITIPQTTNATFSKQHTTTTAWDGTKGGIAAIACNGTLDISDGGILVESKGGGNAYGRDGLAVIGNAQDRDTLPIGQGHGSVFILAKKIKQNNNSRIGAHYSGDFAESFKFRPTLPKTLGGSHVYGGASSPGDYYYGQSNPGGGYRGKPIQHSDAGGGGGYNGGGVYDDGTSDIYRVGSGAGDTRSARGAVGYGSNGSAPQGAHIMIIADTIINFALVAYSSGGNGAGWCDGDHGASGYGASGGNDSGNGGSSGWIFFYVNKTENENYAGVIV